MKRTTYGLSPSTFSRSRPFAAHRTDQELNYAQAYGVGVVVRFPPGYEVGARVRGDGLGNHEGAGHGTILSVSEDARTVRVLYDSGIDLVADVGDLRLNARRSCECGAFMDEIGNSWICDHCQRQVRR